MILLKGTRVVCPIRPKYSLTGKTTKYQLETIIKEKMGKMKVKMKIRMRKMMKSLLVSSTISLYLVLISFITTSN